MTHKVIIGWRELCSFPELGLYGIKAKIDTGATTSCLHAFNISTFEKNEELYVRFSINPIPQIKDLVLECHAKSHGKRVVSDSGGHQELRHVIKARLSMGGFEKEIEVTLTDRHKMAYRMLLGREAMREHFIVDASESYALGKIRTADIAHLYKR